MDALFSYLSLNGIIDPSYAAVLRVMTDQFCLEKHKNKIFEGSDGYWYTYLPDEGKTNKRRKIKKRTKDEVIKTVVNFYSTSFNEDTIKDIFTEWNDRRLLIGKIKPSTHTRNEQVFKRHFSSFGSRAVSTVTPDDVCSFLEEQTFSFNLTRHAYVNLKSILKGILKTARKKRLLKFSVDAMLEDVDICDRDFSVRVVSDEKEIFFDDEMTDILLYCYEHKEDICCIGVALMFVTGMRVGEVVALRKEDILDGAIYVSRTESRYRKDDHIVFEVLPYPKTPAGIRRVILPEDHLWILERMKAHVGSDGFIFYGKEGNRLHTQAVRKRLYQICKKLSITVRSPHKIRKTYGSILLDNNVDRKLIEKQMGHTDISCTEKHYHRDRRYEEEKRQIINSIPQLRTF